MRIAKHLEAIVIAVIAIAAATSMATASVSRKPAAQAPLAASADAVTHIVYVSARRLSAEEKAGQ